MLHLYIHNTALKPRKHNHDVEPVMKVAVMFMITIPSSGALINFVIS